MEALTEAFRVLGDSTRLRILRLVAEARLNVSEVVSLVGVTQSSVSHHLAKLKALELIREERQGGFSFYTLAIDAKHALAPLIRLAREAEDVHGDRARLTELLQQREDVRSLNEKLLEPGQSWRLWSLGLASLLPPLEVADFGCGTGAMSVELARWAKKVTAIDRSATAIAQAKERATREGLSNLSFLEADLHELPLPSSRFDLVVISQSLHHVSEHERVLQEALRILKPGGRVMVLELQPHDEQWVRERLGHQHLGFEPDALRTAMRAAGFGKAELSPAPRDVASPFKAFLLTAARPQAQERKAS